MSADYLVYLQRYALCSLFSSREVVTIGLCMTVVYYCVLRYSARYIIEYCDVMLM